jgi:hypothetical protein
MSRLTELILIIQNCVLLGGLVFLDIPSFEWRVVILIAITLGWSASIYPTIVAARSALSKAEGKP